MKTNGDILKRIHYSIFGTTIGKTDVVSGKFHLKLLSAYRAYDKMQKQILLEQQTAIANLTEENDTLRRELDRYVEIFNQIIVNCRSKDIVSKQRAQIVLLLQKQVSMKEEIRQLKLKNGKLANIDQPTAQEIEESHCK